MEWQVVEQDEPERRPWRVALEKFLAAGFRPGQVVEHQWFYDALGIEMPRASTPKFEADRLELRYASEMGQLKDALLEEHKVCLKSAFARGYEWVHSAEQADRAVRDMVHGLARSARKGVQEAVNVNTSGLSDAERQRQRDLLAHASTVAAMLRAANRESRRRLRRPKLADHGQAESA